MLVVDVLVHHGIDYMVTGSVASSLQGEARTTHDIDLVVALHQAGARILANKFTPPDYYLSESAMDDAIRNRSSFNLLSLTDGNKVDFWMLTDEPFDQTRFGRKYVEDVMGMKLKVSSPEDTILVKLKWAQMYGGSEKQFTDATRVYEVQHGKLDMPYLNDWAVRLGVQPLWERLQNEAEIP